MKGKILYLMLLLVTLWAAITRDSEFPRFLFMFLLLFALFMGIWVHQMAKIIKAQLILPRSSVIRGEKALVKLSFFNPSVFPVGDIRITAQITGGGQIVRHTGVAPGSHDLWQLELLPVHCGEIRILITELRIFDYLGLFSARLQFYGKRKTVFGTSLTVLPKITPYSSERLRSFTDESALSQEMVLEQTGADSQEIFDTRYYRQGDTPKSIHWKLSAKADDILVKEFSLPAGNGMEIYLDMSGDENTLEQSSGNNRVSPEVLDNFWDVAASVGNALAEQDIPFVYIVPLKQGEPFQCQVPSVDRLYLALEELVVITPGDCEALPSIPKDKSLRITLDGNVSAS